MSVSTKCPSAAREVLELARSGSTADSDQAVVVSHLDQCTGCQQALEALANDDVTLAKTLRDRPSVKTPDVNSAYWPALKKAEQALTLDTPTMVEGPSPEISALAFLDPPDDGNHLGKLSHFNIVRVVGRGGMGIVLQATDTCLERDVAIKLLDPEVGQGRAGPHPFLP